MAAERVLIVEDEFLVATLVEQTLLEAGYEVCGIAASEAEALELGERFRPTLALVDIRLSPGDGRVVARELSARHDTLILFASAHCDDLRRELVMGTLTVCLDKPYDPRLVPAALAAAKEVALGCPPPRLPPGLLYIGRAGRGPRDPGG